MNKSFSLSSARIVALAAFGAATLSLFSVSASAQAPAPQQQVNFDDLDLTKARDTERLYTRLRTASTAVCSDFADYRSARTRDQHRDCIDRAMSDAIETIGNSSLAALHASKKEMRLAQSKSDAGSKS
jgi:UrcA family protein